MPTRDREARAKKAARPRRRTRVRCSRCALPPSRRTRANQPARP